MRAALLIVLLLAFPTINAAELPVDRPGPDAPLPEDVAQALGEAERLPVPGEGKDGGFSVLRTNDRTKPVLLVHGRDNYDMAGYATLRNYYIAQGYATVKRVGYYGGECNVELRAEGHGSHNSWYGGSGEHSSKTGCIGGATQVHDLDTDIMHLSYHLAWLIHNTYGAGSVTIDAVGHSMGGLMIRYAIINSGTGGVWPAKLRVEDAATFGTPHGGLGTSWCKWSPWADVRQMCSDNTFISSMQVGAKRNPQGNGGTDWTAIGSDCDSWVAWNLATQGDFAHKVVYVSPCYGHSDYYTDVGTASDATADYMDAPATTWSRWSTAPHSGRWSNNALYYGTW